MRKSLLITSDFPPVSGGISNYLWNLWRNLPTDKRVILAPDVKGAKEFDGTHNLLIYRRKYIQQSDSLFGKVRQILLLIIYTILLSTKEKFSSIHCGHGISSGIAGYLCHIVFGTSYYIYLYGGELEKYRILSKPFLKRILENTEKIFAISKYVRDEYISRGIKGNFLVITPGVEVEKFKAYNTMPKILKEYKQKGEHLILSVGRIVKMKGHDMVINALPKIISKIPNILYIIVGEGPYRKRLERIVEEKGLEDNVLFTGYVNKQELPAYYYASDLLILLSTETKFTGTLEGFGIVFLEANACAKPVIGARTGGIKEAIENGVTGLLVNPFDIDEIANAITKILQNKEYAKRLGEQGRKRAKGEFGWEKRVKIIEKFL